MQDQDKPETIKSENSENELRNLEVAEQPLQKTDDQAHAHSHDPSSNHKHEPECENEHHHDHGNDNEHDHGHHHVHQAPSPATTHASDQQPVKQQDYDLLEVRGKRKETNDPEVEEYFKAKELFRKGYKIATEIPTESDEETLRKYEQKILESTKYLVDAFLLDEKATDMLPRIMTLAQQYEKLSKFQWGGDEHEKKENDETSTSHETEFTKESLILVIWLLYNGRQFSFCIQTLNIALAQLEPQLHPRLYHLRAICHFNLNDYKSCIKDLERLVSIKPDFVDAYSIQGSIHMSQGDRMEAARNFKIYVEKANKDSISYSHALYALSALTIQNNNSTATVGNRKQASHSLRNQQAFNYYQKAKEAEKRYEYLYGRLPEISEVKRTVVTYFEQKNNYPNNAHHNDFSNGITANDDNDNNNEEDLKVVEKDPKKEADNLTHVLQRLRALSYTTNNQQPLSKEKKCNCCGSQTRKDLEGGETTEEKNLKLLVCGGCSSVNYCSKECQKKDWKNGHKKLCPTLKNSQIQLV